MADAHIHCSKCGNQILKSTTEPPVIGDVTTISCAQCGHILSEDEITSQVITVSKKQIKEMVSRTFGKVFKK